jgi:hypothetical protein
MKDMYKGYNKGDKAVFKKRLVEGRLYGHLYFYNQLMVGDLTITSKKRRVCRGTLSFTEWFLCECGNA